MRRECYPLGQQAVGMCSHCLGKDSGVGQTNIPPWCMAQPVPRECVKVLLWPWACDKLLQAPLLPCSVGVTKIPTRDSGSSLISSTADVGVTVKGPGPFPCPSMCIHGYCRGEHPAPILWQAWEELPPLSGVGTSRIMVTGDLTSVVPSDTKELKYNQFNVDVDDTETKGVAGHIGINSRDCQTPLIKWWRKNASFP